MNRVNTKGYKKMIQQNNNLNDKLTETLSTILEKEKEHYYDEKCLYYLMPTTSTIDFIKGLVAYKKDSGFDFLFDYFLYGMRRGIINSYEKNEGNLFLKQHTYSIAKKFFNSWWKENKKELLKQLQATPTATDKCNFVNAVCWFIVNNWSHFASVYKNISLEWQKRHPEEIDDTWDEEKDAEYIKYVNYVNADEELVEEPVEEEEEEETPVILNEEIKEDPIVEEPAVEELITINEHSQEEEKQPEETLGVLGAITEQDLELFRQNFQDYQVPERTWRLIATKLFRKAKIRTLSQLDDESEEKLNIKYDIMSDFQKFQSVCVQKPIIKKQKEIHNNNCIYVDVTEYVPIYNPLNPSNRKDLMDFLKHEKVLPDFNLIKQKLLPEDWNKAKSLLRKITEYYKFDDEKMFLEGLALTMSNAKSKAFNRHPELGVAFSICSSQNRLGKGFLRDMIVSTYDEVFETQSVLGKYEKLTGHFNAIMLTRGFIKIDEKSGFDSQKCEDLKSIITEPEVSIEKKGKDAFTAQNLATLICCSNTPIKPVMGLQEDRRLIEVQVVKKLKKMPEKLLHDLLIEVWKIIPFHAPNGEEVTDTLLSTSREDLDKQMAHIIIELYDTYSETFIKNQTVNQHALKESIKKMGGIPFDKFFSYVKDKELIYKYRGWLRWSKKVYQSIVDEVEAISKDDEKPFEEDDIMKL